MESKDLLIILFVIASMSVLFVWLMVSYTREINKYNKEREEDLKQQDVRRQERRAVAHAEQMARIKKTRELEDKAFKQKWGE